MEHDPIAHELLMAFYAAVHSRQVADAQARLRELEAYAGQHSQLAPWCLYLSGIMANERDQDWGQGKRIFGQVLAAIDPVAEPLLAARASLALGVTCYYLGQWNESIAACRASLPVFAALERPLDVATALKQIAISCFNGYLRNDLPASVLEEASASGRQALETLAAIAQDGHVLRLEASLWNTLGGILRAQDRWTEAIDALQHNLALCRQLGDQHCRGIATADLADTYRRMGKAHWPAAHAAYQEALGVLHDARSPYFETTTLVDLASLFHQQGDPQQALHTYRQAIAHIESLRAGQSSEDARTSFFATTVSAFAQAVLLCLQEGLVGEAFNLTERARSRAFLDLLQLDGGEMERTVETRSLTLAQIQPFLPADALLLCYFTTGGANAASQFDTPGLLPAKTLLFAVTRAEVQAFDLGVSPSELRPQRLHAVTERHFLQPAIRRKLYDRLLEPVADLLARARRVYIVPHGPLHYIPFQALIACDGETTLRPGGPELVYGPSASVLFHRPAARQQQDELDEARRPCLALAYNGEGGQRLRFAEEEALAVAAFLGGDALTGAASKRAALFQRGGAARVLHISCHGRFNPDSPLESCLELGVGQTLTAGEVIDHLHLSCELVTLSACESGLSRVRSGDELMGLVRAFMLAGAPAVVATLWRVDERSTRILMERFYREAASGANFAQALQRAQLYLRTLTREEAQRLLGGSVPGGAGGAAMLAFPFADPYYWASFILIGVAQAVLEVAETVSPPLTDSRAGLHLC